MLLILRSVLRPISATAPETQGGPIQNGNSQKMEGFTMSRQVRVALVLAAVGIITSVAAEWAIRHLTESEPTPIEVTNHPATAE